FDERGERAPLRGSLALGTGEEFCRKTNGGAFCHMSLLQIFEEKIPGMNQKLRGCFSRVFKTLYGIILTLYIYCLPRHSCHHQSGTRPWLTIPLHTTAPGSIANAACSLNCPTNSIRSPPSSNTSSSSSTRSAWRPLWHRPRVAAAGRGMTAPPSPEASSPRPF